MTQEISSLMDGELEAHDAERTIGSCCASEEQKKTWYLYHAIGDAMRGQAPRRLALPTGVIESLKTQPTVLAPKRRLETTFARIALRGRRLGRDDRRGRMDRHAGRAGRLGPGGGQILEPDPARGQQGCCASALDVQDYLAAHRQQPRPELYRPVNNRAPAAAR